MKRPLILAGLLALAAIAWVLSGQLSQGDATPQGRKPPADLAAAERVASVRVRHQSAQLRTASHVLRGRTEAVRAVTARSETYGRIMELRVELGAHVSEGDVIARLAPEDRIAKLDEAKALRVQREIEFEAAQKLSEKGFRAQTQVAAAKAALEAAAAAVDAAEVALDNTTIYAPFDGIVYAREAEMGDFLETGDEVAKIVDLDPILIVAEVSERDVGGLKEGQAGQARLVTGKMVEGRVRFISPVADSDTRTFKIELEVPNPEGAIADGLTAELFLPTDSIEAHLVSPAVLALSDAGDLGVKLVSAENKVEFHPVEIIDTDETGVWIAGLPSEVVLITVGQEYVKSGDTVQPIDEKTLRPLAEGLSS